MIRLHTLRWSRFKQKLFSVTFTGIRYDVLELFIPIWDTKTISISFWWDSLSPFIMWTLFIMFTGARQWVRHAIAAARQRHPCAYHPCLTTLSIPLSLNDMSQCIILPTSTSYSWHFIHVFEDHHSVDL